MVVNRVIVQSLILCINEGGIKSLCSDRDKTKDTEEVTGIFGNGMWAYMQEQKEMGKWYPQRIMMEKVKAVQILATFLYKYSGVVL